MANSCDSSGETSRLLFLVRKTGRNSGDGNRIGTEDLDGNRCHQGRIDSPAEGDHDRAIAPTLVTGAITANLNSMM